MKIKVERSGGFAGINTSKVINGDNLPRSIANTVNELVKYKKEVPPMGSSPKGAADHFVYKISIEDGNKNHIIECNQYNIDTKMKSLISYVENNS